MFLGVSRHLILISRLACKDRQGSTNKSNIKPATNSIRVF